MSKHRFNRRVGLGEESPSTIGGRIRQFEQELVNLQAALNPEHQYSVSNLASCEWPAQFIMLHSRSAIEPLLFFFLSIGHGQLTKDLPSTHLVSYHQCHCDIYRIFLNGYSEAAPTKLLASISAQDRLASEY